MRGGDVLLADRAYVDFGFLHGLTAREVFWVLRQKANMLYKVVESRETSGDVLSDETVRLAAADTAAKYPETFRRVRAAVWMDVDIVKTLRLYGMASPPHRPRPHYIQQRLAGF